MKPNLNHEQALWRSGKIFVAGVDEAGRGALAGAVVAGAVVVSESDYKKWAKHEWFKRVADSKALSPKVRERIFEAIEKIVPWALGTVNSKTIDEIGIGEANRRAVRLAVTNLKTRPSFVLVDYVAKLGGVVAGVEGESIIDGDAKVFSVALASVVAKVQRDRMMIRLHEQYPKYGFDQHKGYGTERHLKALRKYGPCPVHRRSYRPVQLRLV